MRSFISSALVAVITFFTLADAASPPSFGEARSASWYKLHRPRHFANTTIMSEITTTESKTETTLPIATTDLSGAVSSPGPKSEVASTSESTSPAYILHPKVTISEDLADPSIKSTTTEYTTTTIFTTRFRTITSCAPTVTKCPVGSVATETIPLYTTVSPISEQPSPPKAPKAAKYTTSTAYTTKYETIISCAPEVTNCPAESTILVTKTSALYTTICPVTDSGPEPTTTFSRTSTKTVVTTVYSVSSQYKTKTVEATQSPQKIFTFTAPHSTRVVTVSYGPNYAPKASSASEAPVKSESQPSMIEVSYSSLTTIAEVVEINSAATVVPLSSVSKAVEITSVATVAPLSVSRVVEVTSVATAVPLPVSSAASKYYNTIASEGFYTTKTTPTQPKPEGSGAPTLPNSDATESVSTTTTGKPSSSVVFTAGANIFGASKGLLAAVFVALLAFLI